MLVEALEVIGQEAAARFQHCDPQLREAFENAAAKNGREPEEDVHREAHGMCDRVGVREAILREAAPPGVKGDRDIQLRGELVERKYLRIVGVLAQDVHGEGEGHTAQLGHGAARLDDAVFDRPQG